MLTNLRLENFKNFKKADLKLGPFTVLVGANASGKSNVRDAFRFLHGVSRGYRFADILGEVRHESGALQWAGIRGGSQEVAFKGGKKFHLGMNFIIRDEEKVHRGEYQIGLNVGENGVPPKLFNEQLRIGNENIYHFEPDKKGLSSDLAPDQIELLRKLEISIPIIYAMGSLPPRSQTFRRTGLVLKHLSSMRFIELYADAMRRPSQEGQTILGDRGENLSSVLKAICDEKKQKKLFLSWLRELTPMDVVDLEFQSDLTGKVLLVLKEKGGKLISAHSASDGTLRFLALLAALLGPEPSRFYFIEELENGIHPTRLHLLIRLIEKKVAEGKIQVVATTHSPYLVGLLNEESRKYVSIINREEGAKSATITNLMDIPHAEDVLKKHDLTKLHATGWMEDVIAFSKSKKT